MKRSLLLIYVLLPFLAFSTATSLFADDEIEQVRKSMPALLGANNIGKEFWFSIPPCYEDESGGNNFLKIFVTSPVRTKVTVEVPCKGIQFEKITIPNDVIGFDLMPAQAQCFLFSGRTDQPKPETVYEGAGVHVYADEPVAVYVMVRYKYTSDGFLAIPNASLGEEYVVASYPDMVAMYQSFMTFPSITTITAAYDNTRVKFVMGGTSRSQTGGGLENGEMTEATLNKGDVWVFMSDGPDQDLTGSRIIASAPVAVVSGNHCANIPITNRWCDYVVEMDLPVQSWGNHYHVGKIPNRRYNGIVRIFSSAPQTRVYRDGQQIFMLPDGPGGIIQRGYIEARVYDGERRPAVISGDKPINVVFYNPGTEEDINSAKSDPFVMAITPVELYQKEITFCTPAIKGGLGFDENYLNLVYETDDNGLMPDHIEYTKVVQGELNWERINAVFPGEGDIFSYDINGKKFAVKTILLPGDGVYKIRSATKFACYSYGFSDYDSYGYPTSASVLDLASGDNIVPIANWEIQPDGSVRGGLVTDPSNGQKRASNIAAVFLLTEHSNNYELSYDSFIPGKADKVYWDLDVQDKKQDAKAFVLFVDRAGNDELIKVEYESPKITIEPAEYNFGPKSADEIRTASIKIVNNSPQKDAIISNIKFKTNQTEFTILSGASFPLTLKPAESHEIVLSFNAEQIGKYEDALQVYIFDELWLTAVLAGSVETAGSAEQNSVAFGIIDVNPNPISDETFNISFAVEKAGLAQLKLTSSDGKFQTTLFNSEIQTGTYTITSSTSGLPSGVYFCELISGAFRQTKKIIVVR